ncbi:MAG: polyprenyl synthetase family protein, partial [Defluviitaleaceae bacterium]|nr:polyprenyl synthetase family protein [Defluviitaleaceae bacterium]
LLEIHTKKTAKLFIAAFVAGAHIGGADIDTIKRFEKIGEKFGILFQIQDDLQDMTGYANIFGEKKTRATLKALNIEVLALLEQEKNSQFFTDLVNYLTSERS